MKKGYVLLAIVAVGLAAGWYIVKFISGQGWELGDRHAPPVLTQGRVENLILPLTRKDTPMPGIAVRFAPNPNFSGLPEGFVHSNSSGNVILPGVAVLSPDDQILEAVLESGPALAAPVKVTPVSYSLGALPRSLVQHGPEDLVLTLKADGMAVPAGTAVSFAASPVFRNLPEGVQRCENGGKIKLTGITAEAVGSGVLNATVNGSPVSVTLHARPAIYSLSMKENQVLGVGVEQTVQFAFLQNGRKLPEGMEVALTYDSDADVFASPPASAIVDKNGLFSLTLLGQAAGEANITARLAAYNSGSAGCPLEVKLAAYTIGLGSSPDPDDPSRALLTATVTNHNLPASGQSVNFAWKVKGGSQEWQAVSTEVTDAGGLARYTPDETDEWKTITVRASLQNDASRTAMQDVRFGTALPRNFIAMHPDKMDWESAKNYCESQGGKLPAVRRTSPCDETVITIDGFGVGAWPSALPRGSYWTSGETCYNPGFSWAVQPAARFVRVDRAKQSIENHVACVP